MPIISISENHDDNSVTISIRDRFDFSALKEFRSIYKKRTNVGCYELNMSQVSYVDSSALGMMLLLREHAEANHGRVVIANCSPEVKKILTIANFDRFFEIK